jgi:hypothetical protein
VLVLFAESLILFVGDRRTEFAASAPATALVRAAAHVPVGIYASLEGAAEDETALDPLALDRLSGLQHAQLAARSDLAPLDPAARKDVEAVLDASQTFLGRALAQRRVSTVELGAFASKLGPLLLRLTEHATRLELAALDAAAEQALERLSVEQSQRLEVVVAGVHQARARSLGLQYFQRRFGETAGEEKRVVFAEAAADPNEARALIGTRRLDRAIARAFFGDEKRLQRDVLGDAAARQLERTALGRIV